jgi:hypothetical protein
MFGVLFSVVDETEPDMKCSGNNYSQGAMSHLVNGEGSISADCGLDGVRQGNSFTVVMDGGADKHRMTCGTWRPYLDGSGPLRAELSLFPVPNLTTLRHATQYGPQRSEHGVYKLPINNQSLRALYEEICHDSNLSGGGIGPQLANCANQ